MQLLQLVYVAAFLAGTAMLFLFMHYSLDASEFTATMHAADIRRVGNGVPDSLQKSYPICRSGGNRAS